jgi:hypothetical protein
MSSYSTTFVECHLPDLQSQAIKNKAEEQHRIYRKDMLSMEEDSGRLTRVIGPISSTNESTAAKILMFVKFR